MAFPSLIAFLCVLKRNTNIPGLPGTPGGPLGPGNTLHQLIACPVRDTPCPVLKISYDSVTILTIQLLGYTTYKMSLKNMKIKNTKNISTDVK